MAADVIKLTKLDNDDNAMLAGLLGQLDAKMPRNLLRAKYYDGKRAARAVTKILPPHYNKLGLVLGWPAKATDLLARRCNLERFVWADGELDDLGAGEVWDDNRLASEIDQALTSSLLHAVAFGINSTGGDGEPESLVHFTTALTTTGDWNPRLRRMDSAVSVTDRDGEGNITGLVFWPRDGVTVVAEKDSSGWTVEIQDHPWQVPVEPLVYKPRLGRPFGSSRISRTVMSLTDGAVRTVIRMEGHADIYSYPDLWLLGADRGALQNEDGSSMADWEVAMGKIKALPDDDNAEPSLARATIQSFPSSSPTPHLEMFKQQAQSFSGETSIPLTSLGVSDMSNPTSADSYLASREDLISEAEGATDEWKPALRRVFTRALAIKNGLSEVPPEWRTIDAQWRSPVHLSRAAAADAGSKQLAAVPWLADTEVGLELIGLTPQQVERALGERRRVEGRRTLLALTGQSATAEVPGGAGQPS